MPPERERPSGVGRWRRVLRCILGAPDYADYLEHRWEAGHPPRLTERQFVDQFFETKGKDVRCC